jgi:hypothetical protein
MAEPFGKKNKGPDDGKRPAPTIEGTATEVSVESKDETVAAGGERQDDLDDLEAHDELASPPPPRPSRFGSFASHLAAGILGGLIGVAGLALAWNGLDLTGEKTVMPKLNAVDDRLAKLEAATKTLETRAPETPPEVSALQDRVGQAEAMLNTLADAAKDNGPIADIPAISKQIADTEQRLNAKIDSELARVDDANASTVQALQDQIADLRTRLSALAEAGLAAETEEIQPEIEALDRRIANLEDAIPGIAEIVSKETEEAKAAALAIAFGNLRAALSEGRSFDAELDTLKTLSPNADLGVLAAHAKTGIPTMITLARSFDAAKDIALTQAPPASDGSFLGDLQARAQSLVTIRRLDEAATGDEPAAVLARAKADLGKGQLAESVKEIEMLDGAPRNAFAAWLDQARIRLDAEDELKRLEGRLLVSVGGAAQQTGRD